MYICERSEASIEEMTEESSTLASEIASLQDEIKALDKAVGISAPFSAFFGIFRLPIS